MNKYKREKILGFIRGVGIPLIVLVIIIFSMLAVTFKYSSIETEQNRQITLMALKKASVQCYADEGSFPSEVDYLIENYGVKVDFDSFLVVYDCMAPNICPTIEVYAK